MVLDHEQMQRMMDELGPDDPYSRPPVVDMSEGESLPPDEDEMLKLELLQQNADLGPDDGRGDDEIYAEAMRNEAFAATMRRGGAE